MQFRETQLCDVTITVAFINTTDEGKNCASSFVLRGDLEFNPDEGSASLIAKFYVDGMAHLNQAKGQ